MNTKIQYELIDCNVYKKSINVVSPASILQLLKKRTEFWCNIKKKN